MINKVTTISPLGPPMRHSIEEYATRQSKRRFKRRKYDIVPARIAPRFNKIHDTRAVLWDVYGTLLTLSVGDLEDSLARKDSMLEAFGLTIKEFGLGNFLDGNPPETLMNLYIREIRKTHNRKRARGVSAPEVKIELIWLRILRRLGALGYVPSGGEIDADLAFKIAYFFDDVYQAKALYPGAAKTLQGIKGLGLGQGIISNAQFYTPIALNIVLRRTGYGGGAGRRASANRERSDPYNELFDRSLVFFSYRLGVSKPNPLAFERARDRLRGMGVKPSRVIYVGNNVLNDMLPASKIGFRTALFAGDKESLKLQKDRPECAKFKPDAVIASLPQLLDMIG